MFSLFYWALPTALAFIFICFTTPVIVEHESEYMQFDNPLFLYTVTCGSFLLIYAFAVTCYMYLQKYSRADPKGYLQMNINSFVTQQHEEYSRYLNEIQCNLPISDDVLAK